MVKSKTDAPELVTKTDIARIYDVSIHAVNMWIHEKKLPPYYKGNVWLASDVEAAVNKIRAATAANMGLLTKKEVFDIYKRREVKKQSLQEIADAYNRTRSAISRIIHGHQYRKYWQEYHQK